MPAPEGNDNNAYSLAELKGFIKNFCEHISEGLSKTSFVDCDYRTIESALEKHSVELQSEKREVEKAFRKSRLFWETQGRDMVTGVNETGNATAWIFNMKNRFCDEWKDKHEVDTTLNITDSLVITRTETSEDKAD